MDTIRLPAESSGAVPQPPNKKFVTPEHLVECQYAWRTDDFMQKLKNTELNQYLQSYTVGAEDFSCRVGFRRLSPKKPTKNFSYGDEEVYVLLLFKFSTNVIRKEQLPATITECLPFTWLKGERVELNATTRYDSRSKSKIFSADARVGQRIKVSVLRDLIDSAGALDVRFILAIGARTYNAYGLAKSAHQLRMHAHFTSEDEYDPQADRFITIACPEMPAEYENVEQKQFRSLKVWKCILLQASPVFRTYFIDEPDSEENKTGIVTILDFSFSVVQQFVDFIKLGPSTVRTTDEISELARLADKYMVWDLYAVCFNLMLKSISVVNIIDYFGMAYLLDEDELKKACIKELTSTAWGNNVRGQAEFWNDVYERLGPKVMLIMIVRMLRIDAEVVFGQEVVTRKAIKTFDSKGRPIKFATVIVQH